MNPLPSVETVCGMLQQEGRQKEVPEGMRFSNDSTVLMTKNVEVKCNVRGITGHSAVKRLQVIGYLSWHQKSKKTPQKRNLKNQRSFNSRMRDEIS